MSTTKTLRQGLGALKKRTDNGVRSLRTTHEMIRALHDDLGTGINELAAIQDAHLDITLRMLDRIERLEGKS